MSGNVWEWCSDYAEEYSSDTQINPTGPNSGTERIIRGGCLTKWDECCTAYRECMDPGWKDERIGFRLALSE